MTPRARPSTKHGVGYRHEALFCDGTEDFLARTVPFVVDGLAAGEPVMVAVTAEHWAPLCAALGPDAERVQHVDMGELGRNPSRIIPAWLDFIEEHADQGRPLRGIGEPIWAGRSAEEVAECQIHEAMLNLAVTPDTPLWLLCPYDTAALDSEVLDEARRSHPTVVERPGDGRSAPPLCVGAGASYAGAEHVQHLSRRALPEPQELVEELAFGRGDLCAIRTLVTRHARAAGVGADRTDDLVLGVNEVTANSLDHGGGQGVLRIWQQPGALCCEVRDAGRISEPLAGRLSPGTAQARGRGLWMVNQLCDLVQIRSGPGQTVVRVITWVS